MFGIGDTEFLLILIFAFLLFVPDKLPALGKTLGKGIRQFREASNSVTKVVQDEVLAPVQESINTEKPLGKEGSSGAASASAAASAAPATSAISAPSATSEAPAPSAGQAETFAQKKARLEREYQEKQKAANTSKTDESKGGEAHG